MVKTKEQKAIIKFAEPDSKQIGTVNKTAAELELYSRSAVINSQPKLEEANDFLKRIKNGKDWLVNWKKEWVEPFETHLKKLKSLTKPSEEVLKFAEITLKGKILDYRAKLQAEAEVKKAEIEEKVKSGEITIDKAIKTVGKQEAKMENFNVRKDKVVVITDASKLPREYLVPDMVKIKADLKAGKEIPGALLEIKEVVVTGHDDGVYKN